MPRVEAGSVCHHVSVLTTEHDRLVDFLACVFGFTLRYCVAVPSEEIEHLLGWGRKGRRIRSSLLGRGGAGMIEVVDGAGVLDGGQSDRLAAGPFQLCLVVTDLLDTLDRARSAGAEAVVGPMQLMVAGAPVLAAVVNVAGTRFQLTQADAA